MRAVIIADAAIKDLYAVELAKQMGAALLTIPSGEKTKSLQTAEWLIDELGKMGCGKETTLIGMGGGVTTDLVGFVASVYKRGVPLVLIPTTLLAMVDASIGGKNGVNTSYGKNGIGTIYPPKEVWIDLKRLETLPEKEWFNGLAEILKMGLIWDSSIWEMAAKNERAPELIAKAIQAKKEVVAQDPAEEGMRRILNFGHTIGHALETVSRYAMSHGEAVAIGSVAEAHLSMRLGHLSEKEFAQIEAIYSRWPLKLPQAYAREKLMHAMAHDKKRAGGEIRFVLIDKVGHAMPFDGAYCRAITKSELESTLDWMER